jgi:hypothetical protein
MITIIVPYRDREQHLAQFLPWMATYLEGHDYHVVVVEQEPGKPFNRGKLVNVGFEHCGQDSDVIVPHDVDMLPVTVDYVTTPHKPLSLVSVGPKLPRKWKLYFGGVNAFTPKQFRKIDGFSNEYWGWGSEDHDLRQRCIRAGLGWRRRGGSYKLLSHPPSAEPLTRQRNKEHLQQAKAEDNFKGGLSTLDYEVLEQQQHADHTLLLVSI